MSQFYNAKRTRRLFDPNSKQAFKISRTKIDLFLNCARCFYIDRRLGVSRPPSFPFHLNSAVDSLLKKEFDIHRAKGTQHPLQVDHGVDAIPFSHDDMNIWRENFSGIQFLHGETNFIVFGAVDDIWVNRAGELIVVDYKATSKDGEVNINAQWQIGYKRQLEVYQWLLRQRGYNVSKTGYFVYCNGQKDRESFDGKLEFKVKLIPYTGDDSWVERAVREAHACLTTPTIPASHPDCDHCAYIKEVGKLEQEHLAPYRPQLRLI